MDQNKNKPMWNIDEGSNSEDLAQSRKKSKDLHQNKRGTVVKIH